MISIVAMYMNIESDRETEGVRKGEREGFQGSLDFDCWHVYAEREREREGKNERKSLGLASWPLFAICV